MTAPTINLNLAQLARVPAIAQLRAEANGFRVAGKQDIAVVKESLGSPRILWIVALKDDAVVGYAAAVGISAHLAEIEGVYLDRRYRGNGIGSSMLTELFRLLGDLRVAAVAEPASARLVNRLTSLGVQMVAPGQSLGLATEDGGFHAVTGRRRPPRIGVGFLRQGTPVAVAWPIDAAQTPEAGDLPEAFVRAYAGQRRLAAVDTLGDPVIVSALAELQRFDLVKAWSESAAPGSVSPAAARM